MKNFNNEFDNYSHLSHSINQTSPIKNLMSQLDSAILTPIHVQNNQSIKHSQTF